MASSGHPSLSRMKQPLVSVGVPTFNRPQGLLRTLEYILSQTYPNLEVLVSDNASTDPLVEEIGRSFALKDPRVHYFRQASNIGAMPNFKNVLHRASGEYFMWAADDDEWSPLFVEMCISQSEHGESIGCSFDTLFRQSGRREENPVPRLDPKDGALESLRRFAMQMQPSLIYGLHRRDALAYFHSLPNFDFLDCYFVFRQILQSGFKTIPHSLYVAGVDSMNYEIKYANPESRKFDYAPFFLRTAWLFIGSPRLTIHERYEALGILKDCIHNLIRHHERCDNPGSLLKRQVWMYFLHGLVPKAH
jgi:glycosyltransferase involved in cell wall biosynthesis